MALEAHSNNHKDKGMDEDDRQSTPEEENGSFDMYYDDFEEDRIWPLLASRLEVEEEYDAVVHSAPCYSRVAADMCHCRSREVIASLQSLVDNYGFGYGTPAETL